MLRVCVCACVCVCVCVSQCLRGHPRVLVMFKLAAHARVIVEEADALKQSDEGPLKSITGG